MRRERSWILRPKMNKILTISFSPEMSKMPFYKSYGIHNMQSNKTSIRHHKILLLQKFGWYVWARSRGQFHRYLSCILLFSFRKLFSFKIRIWRFEEQGMFYMAWELLKALGPERVCMPIICTHWDSLHARVPNDVAWEWEIGTQKKRGPKK